LGRRARQRAAEGAPPPRQRGGAANQATRAELKPLAPGERPTALVVATAVALLMAAGNLIAAAAGATPDSNNAAQYTVVTTALLIGAAIGMWRARYWGVLGFEAILGFQIIVLALALIRVEKWWVALIVIGVIALLGWLFWKLVRVMARLQMPERR
jgi:hypothetical protein